MGTIPIGGQNITNDISMVLRTSKSNAERLKILYGVSSEDSHHDEEQILVSRIDEYGEEHIQNISKHMLNSIISARIEEILEISQQHIYENIPDKMLYQRIVITGGGSRLSGLNEFIKAKRYFSNISVRLGKPIGTTGSHDYVKTASFASAAGAILYCLGKGGSSHRRLHSNKTFWQRVLTWFKRGI
jgi:cell division protein FtsA